MVNEIYKKFELYLSLINIYVEIVYKLVFFHNHYFEKPDHHGVDHADLVQVFFCFCVRFKKQDD